MPRRDGEALSIVPMDQTTVEAVYALECRCFSSPWSLNSLRGELANPRAVYYVAKRGGAVAGYIGLHHILDEGSITNVAVSPDIRRQGVGAALLEAVLRYADQSALRSLTLEVRASNAEAIGLYRKYGFAPVGLRRGYYAKPLEDAVLMTLEL